MGILSAASSPRKAKILSRRQDRHAAKHRQTGQLACWLRHLLSLSFFLAVRHGHCWWLVIISNTLLFLSSKTCHGMAQAVPSRHLAYLCCGLASLTVRREARLQAAGRGSGAGRQACISFCRERGRQWLPTVPACLHLAACLPGPLLQAGSPLNSRPLFISLSVYVCMSLCDLYMKEGRRHGAWRNFQAGHLGDRRWKIFSEKEGRKGQGLGKGREKEGGGRVGQEGMPATSMPRREGRATSCPASTLCQQICLTSRLCTSCPYLPLQPSRLEDLCLSLLFSVLVYILTSQKKKTEGSMEVLWRWASWPLMKGSGACLLLCGGVYVASSRHL